MEIRDIYNSKREKIGTFTKGEKLEKGQLYLTVIAYIENEKGELLIQKGSIEKGGLYSSTGGHPKENEDSLQGMITELEEEIGVKVKPEDLELIGIQKEPHRFIDVYYVKIDSNTKFKLQEEEVASVKWLSKESVEKLIEEENFSKTHAIIYNKFIKDVPKSDRIDVKIKTDSCDFKFRVRGIVEVNNKFLCVCMQDADFYCLPGGHVEVGELTKDTLLREMEEEVKIKAKIDSLASIMETTYKRRNKLVHELAYFYKVSSLTEIDTNDYIFYEKDKDGIKKLEFKWFTREELKNVNFKPEYIKQQILDNDFSFKHIMENQ